MKRPFALVAGPLTLGIALALAPPAFAQGAAAQRTQPSATQQTPMGPGMGHGRMGSGHGSGMMQGRGACRHGMGGMMGMGRGYGMMYHTEGSLAFLKAELKVTDKQAEAWGKFSKALRNTADQMHTAMQSRMAEGPPKTLIERLDRHEAMMASHLESLRSTKAALGPFYAALDATQKAKLDDMMAPCGGRGGMAPDDDDSDE